MCARTVAAALVLAMIGQSLLSGQSKLMDINGGRLYVTDRGRGTPIVLLHGGFMDSTMWEVEASALARDFRVVTYDFRGYGQSPNALAPYAPTDDLAGVLTTLGIDRAVIIGLSMGGGVAVDFALAHPSQTLGLLVAEPALGGYQFSNEVNRAMQTVMSVWNSQGKQSAIETFLQQPVFAAARRRPAALKAIRDQLNRNMSMEPNQMRALRPPAVSRLSELRMPATVLVSEYGGVDAKAIASKIVAEARLATRVDVKDSGHMINFERSDEFIRIVREFVASLGRRERAN